MPPTPCLPALPVTPVLPEIIEHLSRVHELVLEAPPGAGKTTLVPLALLGQAWLENQKIVMLEPRRMAARAAAERMAAMLGEPVGHTVGYRVRQDAKAGPSTQVEVITGGILTRWLQDDPSLAGVGMVIFDEFHERNLDSDLGLALSLQGRSLFRDKQNPLKLLVMSATLDGQAVARLLGGAPLVRSEGKGYPVDVVYGAPQNLRDSITAPAGDAVLRALREEHGNLLVFLPGQAEIRQVAQWLQGKTPAAVQVLPLHGGLSMGEQRSAIEPPPPGQRKVVLATDVAESSLTIEGVRVVIDAGRSRVPAFDPNTGMTRLTTTRVSQASSIQRCGRAGRLEPGRCYRLWGETQQHQLAPYAKPEILQTDLAPLALQLLSWGVDSPDELEWLDAPPVSAYRQALSLLAELNAVKPGAAGAWQLTRHGERMARLPTHPRIAHLLIHAQARHILPLGGDIAAVLSDPPRLGDTADIAYPLALLSGDAPCPARHKHWCQQARKQARTFIHLMAGTAMAEGAQSAQLEQLAGDDAVGFLLACAYPDRVARRRGELHNRYQLSNGRSASLAEGDPLANSAWLACAEAGGFAGSKEDRIRLAAAFNPHLLESSLCHLLQEEDFLQWDEKANRLVAERRQRLGALVVESRPLESLPEEAKQQVLVELIRRKGLSLLPWTDELRQWQARVQLLYQQQVNGQGHWPDLSDAWLLDNLEQWLAPYLAPITDLAGLQALDLKAILGAQLAWPLPEQLEQWAPSSLRVPSGSRVPIDYLQSPPVLAVKLQEMFGCQETPRVACGKVPLVIHLLSPARRPLQVTQDLATFWRTGYQEVKKEMKGRYPKHPWPDDPLTARPTQQVKRLAGQG